MSGTAPSAPDDNTLFQQALAAKGITLAPPPAPSASVAPANDDALFQQALAAKGISMSKAPADTTALQTDPGTPLTPADHARGLAALGEAAPAPANAPAPMVPLDSPFKDVQAIIKPYADKYNSGQNLTVGDFQTVKNGLTQFIAKQGPDFFNTAAGKQTAQDAIAKGWLTPDELHAAANQGQGNYLTNVVLPDAANVGNMVANQVSRIGGDMLGSTYGVDPTGNLTYQQVQQGQDAGTKDLPAAVGAATDPRGILQAPLARDIVQGAGGVLRAMDADSAAPSPAGAMIAQGARGAVSDIRQYPVQSALAVAPFLADGLHAGGAAIADHLAPEAATELHRAAPGENNAARAADGKFAPAPKPETPKEVPHVQTEQAPPQPTPQARAPVPAAAALSVSAKVEQPLPAQPAASVKPAYTDLGQALGAGLQKTNGFGTIVLKDGSTVQPNVMSRYIDKNGVMTSQGGFVDPSAISHVVDRDGNLLWRSDTPATPATLPTPPVPEAPVTASPPAAKAAPSEYANSVNLTRLSATPEVTAQTQANVGANPIQPTTIPEIKAAAAAMNLHPSQLAGIEPGQVPAGVSTPVFHEAVRGLGKSLGQKAVDAEQAHAADPSPTNLQAAVDANQAHRDVLQHQQALATNFGQTGALLSHDTTALEAAQNAVQGKRQALAQAASLKPADTPATAVSPKARTYGASNKVFTADAKDAALARIKASAGQLNSGVDPQLLKDATIVGAYHVEAGLRNFGAWAKQMTADIPKFGGLDDAGQQQVYAASRAQYAAGAKVQQRQAASTVFADRLVPSMGRQGASDFINGLANHPVHPDLLGQILRGDPMTPGQARAVAETAKPHLLTRTNTTPTGAVQTVRQAVRDAKAGRLGYDDAHAAVKGDLLPRVDQSQVLALTKDLAAVQPGDFKGLARVYNKYHPSGAGEKIRAYQMNSLLSGPLTLGKILLTHGLSVADEVSGVHRLAQAFNPELVGKVGSGVHKYVSSAMRDSLEGARAHITEGATSAHLRGSASTYQVPKGGIAREAFGGKAAALNLPLRIHGAVYHILGEGLEARGRYEAAGLEARKSGQTLESHLGDKGVVEAGQRYRQEQMFQNPNAAANAANAAARVHPIIGAAINAVSPFREIPANIAGRSLENSGAGLPYALAREHAIKTTGKDLFASKSAKPLTAEQRAIAERNIAFQKARGTLGIAKVAAGAGLGAAGILNAPDTKKAEYGSVNIGNKSVGISELGSVASPYLLGGEIHSLLSSKGKKGDLLAPFLDNPISRVNESADGISKPGGIGKYAGSIAGQAIPSLLAQGAAAFDPSGRSRVKSDKDNFHAFYNQLKNRVPGSFGREGLKPSRYPQASNYKSTGPLSTLSPLPILPRSR